MQRARAREEGDSMEIQRADPERAPRLKQVVVAAKGFWGYGDTRMQRWGA